MAFEYIWYEAWCKSVEAARQGLAATLIIRHPETGRLYVNFDPEILQLIRWPGRVERRRARNGVAVDSRFLIISDDSVE